MALGITVTSNEGGNFLGIVKFDARAGRFFRVDRSQDSSGTWVKNDVEIRNPSFVIDFETIEVGWISFAGGMPDFKLVSLGQQLPVRPDVKDDKGQPAYKQGFKARIKLAKSSGGDVREFSHTAKAVLGQIDALHTQYVNAPESKQGKLPILTMTDTVAVKTGQSTNYAPVLEITGWVDRPDDLPLKAAPVAAAPAPATVANNNPPPPSQMASGAEF
jgi:hypothetical protein